MPSKPVLYCSILTSAKKETLPARDRYDVELQVVALPRSTTRAFRTPPSTSDLPAVDLRDDVSLPDPGVGRRRDLLDVDDEEPVDAGLDALHLPDLGSQLRDRDPDPLARVLGGRLAVVVLSSPLAATSRSASFAVSAVSRPSRMTPSCTLLPGALPGDVADQVARVLDRDVVDADDRVARLDAGPVRRLARLDRLHERAVERLAA